MFGHTTNSFVSISSSSQFELSCCSDNFNHHIGIYHDNCGQIQSTFESTQSSINIINHWNSKKEEIKNIVLNISCVQNQKMLEKKFGMRVDFVVVRFRWIINFNRIIYKYFSLPHSHNRLFNSLFQSGISGVQVLICNKYKERKKKTNSKTKISLKIFQINTLLCASQYVDEVEHIHKHWAR